MEPMDAIRAKISHCTMKYPVQIFGDDQSRLIPISTVVIDILETVASMLLDTNVVGDDKNGKFVFKYTKEYNSDKERILGNATGSHWFKKTEREIKNKWGDDVYLLALNISSDKTEVSRLQKSLWPCYVTVMNLDGSVRRTNMGSEIVGYCPFLPYSTEAMCKILEDKYAIQYGHRELTKLIRRFLEQQFLSHLLKPIRDARTNGPISLKIGSGSNQKVAKFMPELMCYVCKLNLFY
jgi:Plavaka transposase